MCLGPWSWPQSQEVFSEDKAPGPLVVARSVECAGVGALRRLRAQETSRREVFHSLLGQRSAVLGQPVSGPGHHGGRRAATHLALQVLHGHQPPYRIALPGHGQRALSPAMAPKTLYRGLQGSRSPSSGASSTRRPGGLGHFGCSTRTV